MESVTARKTLVLAKLRTVNAFTFWVYIYFVLDFFLRFTNRFPGYGLLRPTVLLVILITSLLIYQKKQLSSRRTGPVFKVLLILIVYLAVSWPFVEWPGSVIKNNFQEFVKAAVFFFFTAYIIDTPRRMKIFLFVFVSTQVFRVVEPLFLHYTTGYWGSRTYLGGGEFAMRLSGAPADIINPNELGFVIATVIPFLHYLLPAIGMKGRLLYLALLPFLLHALILTMSRGAFIALVVVVVFILKESRYKFIILLAIGLAGVVGWSSMSGEQQDRYLSLVGRGDEGSAATAEGRWRGMIQELELGMRRPIFGFGLGTTPEAKTHEFGQRQAAHNLYAELLIEIGIIGASLFLAFLYTVIKSLQHLRRLLARSGIRRESLVFRLVQALQVVYVMYLVYSINYWGLSQYYWYLLAGMVHALTQMLTLSPRPAEGRRL